MKSARTLTVTLIAASLVGAGAPAAADATSFVAAYERYVSGKGFEIGLVNAATGAAVTVPAGVNTNADEFHPALTPDGRYLIFARATLQPQLDGDIVPPEERRLIMVDRQTGESRGALGDVTAPANKGSGATIVPTSSGPALGYGLARTFNITHGEFRPDLSPPRFNAVSTLPSSLGSDPPQGTFDDTPHAAIRPGPGSLEVGAGFRFNAADGAILLNKTRLTRGATTVMLDNVNRPTPRGGDGHVALEVSSSGNGDLATLQFPAETTPSVAPPPITTDDVERMPAWSPPNGVQLGFVRTTGDKRALLVFDTTPGLQGIANPPVNLGLEAPTPQLRAFQATWGGLSLAPVTNNPPVLNCGGSCLTSIGGVIDPSGPSGGGAGGTIVLKPSVFGSLGGISGASGIGIVIARVVGTRRLFGRRIPRVRRVGRVPLGAARRRNLFRWNGRVNGRRLAPGTYLLTFRALNRRGRIVAASRSIRFRLTAAGRVTGVRTVR